MSIFTRKNQSGCRQKLFRFLMVIFIFILVGGAFLIGEETGLDLRGSITDLEHEVAEMKDQIAILKRQIQQ